MAIKKDKKTGNRQSTLRLIVLSAAVMAAFFGAYAYASARSNAATGTDQLLAAAPGANGSATSSGGSGCACCGSTAPTENGLTGELNEGTAKVEGGVQKIDVDLSQGYYSPNQIVLKAGVPAEITFGVGTSCAAQIYSQELGFNVDTYSGPQTVKLPALEPGEYPFACTMDMVFGKIVVK